MFAQKWSYAVTRHVCTTWTTGQLSKAEDRTAKSFDSCSPDRAKKERHTSLSKTPRCVFFLFLPEGEQPAEIQTHAPDSGTR